MELKDYQQTALDTLDAYLEQLTLERARSEQIAKLAVAKPSLGLIVPDYPTEAWKTLKEVGRLPEARKPINYSTRTDGIGQTVPNVCLKIPTENLGGNSGGVESSRTILCQQHGLCSMDRSQ